MNELNLQVNLSYGDSTLSQANSDTLFLFVLWGVLLPLVAAAGLVGNILTMLVLWRREMNSTTILYMRGLVITDTGILIGSVITLTPIIYADYLEVNALTYFRDRVYPHIHTPGYYIIMALQQMNVWITVSVSVERYISICHPFRAARLISRKKTFGVLAGIVVVSLLYNIPHLFAFNIVPCDGNEGGGEASNNATISTNDINEGNKNFKYNVDSVDSTITEKAEAAAALVATSIPQMLHTEHTSPLSTTDTTAPVNPSSSCWAMKDSDFSKTPFYIVYRAIMYLVIIYVLPFVALVVLNTFLIRELMIMQKRNANASSKEENEANMSLVLVLIVMVFIFCQTPGLMSQFEFIPPTMFMKWLGVANLLFATNSAVNFLIYTAFGRKFRRVLLRVFRHISAYQRRRASSASSCHAALTQFSNSNGNDVEMSPLPPECNEVTDKKTDSNSLKNYPSSSETRTNEAMNGSPTPLGQREANGEENTPLTTKNA